MRQEQPFFSIVVPTYARPKQLAACLRALALLEYPRDHFEVIVIDDGSETPPEDVVAPLRDRLDVTLLTQPNAGPAAARNTGAAEARGEFLAFTDDDCAPAPDWLQRLAARFAAAPDPMIGGRTLNVLNDNPYSTASQLLIAYLYGYFNADPSQARFFASNNLALSAQRFQTIGGFDATYTRAAAEDRELCDRWLLRGYRMIYAPEVLIYHAHALTFRTFWRQHFTYGKGAFCFHQARARRGQRRIRAEPRWFYPNLLRYPFLQVRGRRALLFAVLLVMSQGAHTVGYLGEAMNRARRR